MPWASSRNQAKMMKVFIRGVTSDEQVVDVAETEVQPTKDFIYETLKGLGSVSQPEGHAAEFEKTERSRDCSLGDILGRYWDDLIIRSH